MMNIQNINIGKQQIKSFSALLIRLLYFAPLILFCFMTGCKKLVNIGPPSSSLVTATVFNNDESAIAAQFSVYTSIQANLATWNIYSGLSSDELTNYSTNQTKIDLFRNNLNAQADGGVNPNWASSYQNIYYENAIIENVQDSKGMSAKVKQLTIGEAQFMRAYLYWHLINWFGPVPLVLTTDYTKNSNLPRASKSDVYDQIIKDLQSAQTLLSNSFLDASDNSGSSDRVRPTTWAANALLARVYLYIGKYDLAEKQSSLVINNAALFTLVSDLNQVFKMNSSETIWQTMQPSTQLYTNEGNNFILTTPPTASSRTTYAVSPQLLNSFELNDMRRAKWIGSYTQTGTTWYFPYKYKDNNKASSVSEYSMVLRLAEQYLIRAEARAKQNNATGASGAIADLNIIRNRAGLPAYAGASDQASVLAAIARERQVELFTEDHRWFDLKRTGEVDAVMTTVTLQKGGTWSSYQQLYPLPVKDLQKDLNLVQNPGY